MMQPFVQRMLYYKVHRRSCSLRTTDTCVHCSHLQLEILPRQRFLSEVFAYIAFVGHSGGVVAEQGLHESGAHKFNQSLAVLVVTHRASQKG